MTSDPISIYLHWPFCESKCPYCDFNSHVRRNIIQKDWLLGYLSNIKLWLSRLPTQKIKTLYFGGGTPSLMDPNIVSDIIEHLYKNYSTSENMEISLETNPSSFEMKKFKDYYSAGINRISIGAQSFLDKDLKLLGRKHTAKEAISAIETSVGIFKNTSFDLIYGRQFQKLNDWERELEFAISLGTQHLSLYQLTIEKNTAFGMLFNEGKLMGLPDDNLSRSFFINTNTICTFHEFINYEISNFSQTQYECKHNLNYWRCGNFLGIGPGAHGRYLTNKDRFSYANISNPECWLEKSAKGHLAIELQTKLSDLDHFEEFVMMGLRLTDGIDLRQMKSKFDVRLNKTKLDELIGMGFIGVFQNHLKVLPKGKVLLNYITKELLA
ncbi:MAG: radical SAM family heme chaperone HemW [Pseudomonadota bacterium]|nr:radical SAM family heme chaperone HemW [Pseudomonadota bacterium]